jgi:5-formyltetrahydrofolate cyclo-ligase
LSDLRAEKAALRQAVLGRRNALPDAARAELSRRVTAALLAQPALARARTVAGYLSFGSEFDTAGFVAHLLGAGKRLLLPRVDRERRLLDLHAVRDLQGDLVPGVWGIREPSPERCPPATLQDADVLLAPGVAFSSRCERLGYGGGFYDKLLAGRGAHPLVIAAAFDVQIVDLLPTGPDDVPVDLVITESATYRGAPSPLAGEGGG